MFKSTANVLATLSRHRGLLWQFTKRQVELRHKGSHLGLLWSLLGPLILLALYVVVFGFIFDGRFKADASPESRIEYALVLFLGLALHHFVAEILAMSVTAISANPNFVKKVIFPLEILPISAVGGALVHLVMTLALLMVAAFIAGVPVSWTTSFWVIPIVLTLIVACMGAALLLASIGVFWRDIAQVMQFISMALLFASAVFYPVADIPEKIWQYLRFNPLIHAIDGARGAFFWGIAPSLTHLSYLVIIAFGMLLVGASAFSNLRRQFADVL